MIDLRSIDADCCNQRDVHVLRALSLRVLGDAINAHDDGILQAVAGVMAQVVPLDTDSDALESREGYATSQGYANHFYWIASSLPR